MSTRPFLLIWLLFFVATDPLLAHSPMKGMGNFYSGLLHPVFVPAHLLLLTVLGLFIGQKGLSANRLSFAVFLLTTVIGLIGAWFSVGGELEIALLSLSVIIGLLLASNLPIGVYLSCKPPQKPYHLNRNNSDKINQESSCEKVNSQRARSLAF